MSGKFEFRFPFVPPWEDLKMETTAGNGAKVYIFDSCVVRDAEAQAAIDQQVAGVLARAERRRFMQALERRG